MNNLTPAQKTFTEALGSFPDRGTQAAEALKQWPEYDNLYQALCEMGEDILKHSGRFMHNPVSVLRKGDYYHLGINPGGDPGMENTPLEQEIREWSKKDTHAICAEHWKGQYQPTVKAVCREVGIEVEELCSSNLYFCRSRDEASIPLDPKKTLGAFWHVHEAVLDIVKPKCIFVFGTGEGKFPAILDLMRNSKGRPLSRIEEKTIKGDRGYSCRVVDGEYQGRPLKLIGIPHPSHGRVPTQAVLKQIADECRKAVGPQPVEREALAPVARLE